jgi:hypothetical protein
MRVLVVSSKGHDLATIFLYDGLCELAGQDNVVTAEHYPFLSFYDGGGGRVLLGRTGPPPVLGPGGGPFDLVVLHSCFLRDHGWDWAARLVNGALAPKGVVAYVEGGDDATGEVFPPPPTLPVTRVFRREVQPGFAYPYHATPLLWACPAWWLDEPRADRTYDVTCLASPGPVAARWPVMAGVFQTVTRFNALVGVLPFEHYLWATRRSKYVLVPPGAGSDCVRQWEAVGCGAVPVFVGHPPRVREPWFADGEVLSCGVAELPGYLDWALSAVDLPGTRDKMEARARAEHTTLARARRVVELTGVVS